MRPRRLGRVGWALMLLVGLAASAMGQEARLPPGDDEPLPRLEVGGPTSLVTAMTFSPDGDLLYEGGWDKVVRVWRRNARTGTFALDPGSTYRVPIGPGTDGAINAIAISPDGSWLAVAGNGIVRGGAGFRQIGLMVPAAARTEAMREDQGLIYVFNTRSEPRAVRLMRGHRGPVMAVAFVPAREGQPLRLVSAAREGDNLGVARLWDVEKATAIDQASLALDPRELGSMTRPGLAIATTGPAPGAHHVAIAWGDGKLRLWNVGGKTAEVGDGRFNNTIALVGGTRPISGSLRGITPWDWNAEGTGLIDARRPMTLAGPGNITQAPRALALASTRPGGSLDLAAVVTMHAIPGVRAAGQVEMTLKLGDLNARTWGTIRAQVPLWRHDLRSSVLPVLAVDPTGRSLAVAGNANQEVHVFALADLLQGKAAPQRLRGAGALVRQVGFVWNGRNWGLGLDDGAGELFLDPAGSRLTADKTGWGPGGADAGTWRAETPSDDPTLRTVAVRNGTRPMSTIRLGRGQRVGTIAILPPRPPLNLPIVAVGYTDLGEPGLSLFNGLSGEPIRQLSGHLERVRSLAFANDGRLLASAADDRTVCLWSLTDLGQTLGQRGRIAGLAVTESNGGLVVARLDPEVSAQPGAALHEGDAIKGLVVDGLLRPIATVSEFYLSVSRGKPGETVTLRLDRGDVPLKVGQGVDERKPLISMLVTRTAAGASWIGWSPLGPFEASDREAERLLGWHFNTGKAEMPARFALADQYRQLLRPGLIRDLVEQGRFVPPAPPPPRARPDLGLTLDPEGTIDGQGRTVVRQAPLTLTLTLLDRTWTAEDVESVRWRIDKAPDEALTPSVERAWSGDTSRADWGRGTHQVAVTVRTREATPQDFTETKLVRYVPPAPNITTGMPMRAVVVDRAGYRFQARVEPSDGPVKAILVVRSAAGKVKLSREWSEKGPLAIDEPLTLEPGSNQVELSAANAEAPLDDGDLETARMAPRVVIYNKAPAQPPEIVLEGTLATTSGEPVVASASKVRLRGRITAREPLSQAEWLRDEGQARRLGGFVPGRALSLAVNETIDLTPGVQTIKLRARAADSAVAETQVAVDYRPPVPEVADVVLDPADAVVYRDPKVQLKGRLIARGDRHPFEASVIVNGKQLSEHLLIDEAAGTVSAAVPLEPGENRIQVRLGNAWRSTWVTEPVRVAYRRPPQVVAVETSAVGDQPFLDLTARIESADDLPLVRSRVIATGRGRSPSTDGTVIETGELRREGDHWVLSAPGVPIEPGENAVEVWAWNADGQSREPGRSAGIVYRAPPPPKPMVEFVSPGRDTTIGTPTLAVEYRVRSTSPLTKVELLRLRSDGNREVLHSAEVARLVKNKEGAFEVLDRPAVTLIPQDNRLLVVAVNAGGERSEPLTLTYLPPPVRVVVDQIKLREPGARTFVPAILPGNQIRFETMPSGRVTVRGRVLWPDEATRRRKQATRAEVWVDGFPWVEVPIEPIPGRALEAGFEARILLPGEDNEVEVKVPTLAREAGDRPTFRLACTRPERHQRMHLLIVGVGEEDEIALRDRALSAMQGTLQVNKNVFKRRAFDEGRIYGPLVRDVQKFELLYQLMLIRNAINPLQSATEAPNEVVVIYFQGGEWLDRGKPHLRLRTGRGRSKSDVIAADELAALFQGTRGAKLFLFDVTRTRDGTEGRPAPMRVASWPGADGLPIGLLKFTWLNPPGETPTEPPPDARLITALQEAMPRSVTVGEVTSHVHDRADQLGKIYPNLSFDQLLSAPIAELIIGNR